MGAKTHIFSNGVYFHSKIGNEEFLNIGSLGTVLDGFFFVKTIYLNTAKDSMVVAMVATALLNISTIQKTFAGA